MAPIYTRLPPIWSPNLTPYLPPCPTPNFSHASPQENFPQGDGDAQLLHYPPSRVERTSTKAGGPQGKKRKIHGYVVTEDAQWAGWVFIDEDDNPDISPVKRASKLSKKKKEQVEKERQKKMEGKMKDQKFSDWAAVTEALKVRYLAP